MADTTDKFYLDQLPTSEFLKLLNVSVPRINLNKLHASSGLIREIIEKTLYTIPATDVKINVYHGWDGDEELMLGLLAGRYIKKLSVSGCINKVPTISPSVNVINIRVEKGHDCPAINNIAGAENIRKLTLENGEVDGLTWHLIKKRTTKISLRLINTKIINLTNTKDIMEKIDELEMIGVSWEGIPISEVGFERKTKE